MERIRFAGVALVGLFVPAIAAADVTINEVMAVNGSCIADPDDRDSPFDDWIELYNAADEVADISGLYLSDDPGEPTKYRFPAGTTIAPRSHILVWADEEVDQGPRHMPFKLGGDGEDLILTAADGITVIDSITFGAQVVDQSIGRVPDGGDAIGYLSKATPGSPNIGVEATVVEPAWIAGGVQGTAEGTEFDEPNELGFDRDGNLWAGDVYNMRVQIYTRTGEFVGVVGGVGDGPGQFVEPAEGKKGAEAIRVDSKNRMYVVDRGGARINVYDASDRSVIGSFTPDGVTLDDPTGLAIDSKDVLYVADQGTGLVHKVSFDGTSMTYISTFQPEADGALILAKTETLALDEARDRLFASSEDESRVEVFQLSTGKYLGRHVCERQHGAFPEPGRVIDDVEGVAVDLGQDWLLISDEDNGRFNIYALGASELFDPEAAYAFLGAFGRLGSGIGELLSADGVTASPELGLIAIADQGNYRIQVFRTSDIVAALGLGAAPGTDVVLTPTDPSEE